MSHFTWQRAIFTGASPDIVAADMLNFCVRDEYRCIPVSYTHLDVYKRQGTKEYEIQKDG